MVLHISDCKSEFQSAKLKFIGKICLICNQSFQYMHTFMDAIGMHGTMLVFSVVSFVGTVLIMLFIPETKGKSIEEILQILEK